MRRQHVKRFTRGKWTGVRTPYRLTRKAAGGWRIGFGASSFLVAEGSGWSAAEGMRLFRDLERRWLDGRTD